MKGYSFFFYFVGFDFKEGKRPKHEKSCSKLKLALMEKKMT